MMIAAGAGIGMAVSFGAPIGGVLFAYEISWNSTFWSMGLFFWTFVGTTVGVYFYTLLWYIRSGSI